MITPPPGSLDLPPLRRGGRADDGDLQDRAHQHPAGDDAEDEARGVVVCEERSDHHQGVQWDPEHVRDASLQIIWDHLRPQNAAAGLEDADARLEYEEGAQDGHNLVEEDGHGEGHGPHQEAAHAHVLRRGEAQQHRGREEEPAQGDAGHEAGKDQAVGQRAAPQRTQHRGHPHEDEGIHGAFKKGVDAPEQEGPAVRRDEPPGSLSRVLVLALSPAIVLRPGQHQEERQGRQRYGGLERPDLA
mmetsp:Transcript_7380/g.21653  ORF Transcript_7380/g.21653 Transcript_7380/m.21653 type:complete len:244 (+) Transcript_7380:3-734(+)